MKIKTKILCTLLAMSLLVALVGVLAVDRQRASVTATATEEAENVANVLGFIFLSGSNQLHSSTQEIITRLHEAQGRDVVLMNAQQTILADANPSEVGKNYNEDPNDEAGATIKDGKIRTFIETSSDYPAGIKQIVVPIKSSSGQTIGAVVLEYAPLYDGLMQLAKTTMKQIGLVAFGSVVFALLIAFLAGRSIVAPLARLTNVAGAFAAGRMDLPPLPHRTDEIGRLAAAFENMVQKRWHAENELRHARDELEIRVSGRTAELAKANSALLSENAERRQAEQELRWKTAFLEAQVNSSSDGILVVDEQGKMLLQNQRMIDVWKMPLHVAAENQDESRLRWVANQVKNPPQFIERVAYLYSHPGEISREEIELKDGTILDRYSAPVTGNDGKYYGRIWAFRDITERKRAEETLRESEEKFRQLADNIADVFWICSPDFAAMHYVSPGYKIIWGRSMESLYANPHQWVEAILPEERDRVFAIFGTLTGNAPEVSVEYRIARPDGTIRWIHDRGFQVRNPAGHLVRVAGIASDITERKRVEGHLLQSQKMETVGKLAGGIAHEFNSIMTAIIGQSELLMDDLPPGSPPAKNAAEIRKAAERAAILTRQLLAYGRKQILQPEILDLNTVVAGMEHTLRHLMGRAVDVHFSFAAGLKRVKADVGQIEQVVVNIVMNAADAMPNGGKLTVETANVALGADYVRHFPDLKAGEYVMLAIGDTGAGMDEDVKARAFDPFFTTKGVGKGTGLGLATCHGIIKQSGGHIAVYSELGRGTTVKVYLPQVEQKAEVKPLAPPKTSLELPHGTESILLVEDDPSLREMVATLLQRLGYTVLAAANGVEAMTLVHQQGRGHIDLLFTDVVMPQMSGNELADRIRVLHPQTKILFASAYTESAIVRQGVLNPGVALLQKPFTPSALAHKVREILGRK